MTWCDAFENGQKGGKSRSKASRWASQGRRRLGTGQPIYWRVSAVLDVTDQFRLPSVAEAFRAARPALGISFVAIRSRATPTYYIITNTYHHHAEAQLVGVGHLVGPVHLVCGFHRGLSHLEVSWPKLTGYKLVRVFTMAIECIRLFL